jgi:hypothetical protein
LNFSRIGSRNHYAIDARRALDGDVGRLPACFTIHDQDEATPRPPAHN